MYIMYLVCDSWLCSCFPACATSVYLHPRASKSPKERATLPPVAFILTWCLGNPDLFLMRAVVVEPEQNATMRQAKKNKMAALAISCIDDCPSYLLVTVSGAGGCIRKRLHQNVVLYTSWTRYVHRHLPHLLSTGFFGLFPWFALFSSTQTRKGIEKRERIFSLQASQLVVSPSCPIFAPSPPTPCRRRRSLNFACGWV